MITKNTVLIPAALVLALCLPACGEGDSQSDDMGSESVEESLDMAFDEEPIPSQDVADAAAEAEIDESNADDVLAELKTEIDG
ncbi:MAG: hypothetical protein ACI9EF_003946 [Pseudohongiellaceae bacterium]|jgi:hypothetical protein